MMLFISQIPPAGLTDHAVVIGDGEQMLHEEIKLLGIY